MTDREKAMLWLKSFVKNKEPMTLIPKQLIRLMYDALIEQPDIVRCKDCRHCTFSDGEQLADCMIKQGWFPVKPDWFCADGERKEGR